MKRCTSSLDNNTAFEVMNAIDKLDKNLTVFIITLRLSTLSNCSHFIKLVNHEVKYISSYEEVKALQ